MTKYDFVVLEHAKKDPDALTGEMDHLGDLGFAVVGVTERRIVMQRAREYSLAQGGYEQC